MENNICIGDVIKVKPGVFDPDYGNSIEGWAGKVLSLDGNFVEIEWTEETLEQVPRDVSILVNRDGLDETKMYLQVQEVEMLLKTEILMNEEIIVEKARVLEEEIIVTKTKNKNKLGVWLSIVLILQILLIAGIYFYNNYVSF